MRVLLFVETVIQPNKTPVVMRFAEFGSASPTDLLLPDS
jgi:hypothetical protein